jgi:hypothetical protein
MQEDIQNNFILLSKVAKEKKYAQEYLGLLARRGDIGSIRIGKRWYTTWAWFEEFLENGQKKKEVVDEVQVALPIVADKIVMEKISPVENKEEKIKINIPFVFSEREKVLVDQPIIAVDKININLSASPIRPVKMQTEKIQIRRFAAEQSRKTPISNFAPKKFAQSILQDEPRLRNAAVAEKNKYAVPFQEIKFKKKADIFSPDFAGEEKKAAPMFGRFAFAMSFAAILLLVAASGYFVWSGGLFVKGTVAGASDERSVGFSGITSGGEYVLTSAGDKMKESLSVSRVMVEAAKEKLNQGNLVN